MNNKDKKSPVSNNSKSHLKSNIQNFSVASESTQPSKTPNPNPSFKPPTFIKKEK